MAKPSGRRTSQFRLPTGQPSPAVPSVENNYTQGLKTEFTGLNFPEQACVSTSNCVFTRVGNVTRRGGLDYEANGIQYTINRTNCAISSFLWQNAGGLGNQLIQVEQVGANLLFYIASNATVATPLSQQARYIIDITQFQITTGSIIAKECQYAAGNGYLFVFHPSCDPFYCSYDPNTGISPARIKIQIRDFIGLNDGLAPATRPTTDTREHAYNLFNQGWLGAGNNNTIFAVTLGTNATVTITNPGAYTFPGVPSGTGVFPGAPVSLYQNQVGRSLIGVGTVASYSGTSITLNLPTLYNAGTWFGWEIDTQGTISGSTNLISTWFSVTGNYPSNSDIWWAFKGSSGNFSTDLPTTINNVTINVGVAPKGYFLLNAFDQQRSSVSGVTGITPVTTTTRPRTGAWFQGRVWYAGVDASQPATGDAQFYTWTENIYFSQIVTDVSKFGLCYENNDPTSENLNDLLPTDGGVIQIQGCGSIYKLFPVVNGLIVFAANGIWFITGNTGIGFTANDYTISKVSGEHSISSTSFVDVAGWPVFWNYNGIFSVQPGQSLTSGQRALEVKDMTLETIRSFYQQIPLSSKLYARGSYNHISGVIQWLYLSSVETDVTSRYNFDGVLNFLTYTGAFYPWQLSPGANIHDVTYIEFTGNTPTTSPTPVFKYFTSTPIDHTGNFTVSFSEERDFTFFNDWSSTPTGPVPYTSYFYTGYRLKGMAQRKFYPEYIYIFSEDPTSAYSLQGIWDFAISGQSGRMSGVQVVNNNAQLFQKTFRRHRLRGHGYVLQFVVKSIPGQNFNIAGWSVLDVVNMGV